MNRRGLPSEALRSSKSGVRAKEGFTLIEIIISIAIAGIIAGVFAVVINAGMGNWFFIKGQKKVMMETRGVIKKMVREIRRTRDNSDSGILNFTSTRYRFRDVDNNTVNYQQAGTDLERNGSALLKNLPASGGLNFIYLDASGNVTAVRSAVRTIRIKLIVEDGDNRARLQSAASLRNR